MWYPEDDWLVIDLIDIYKKHFELLKKHAQRDGFECLFQEFLSVLQHEGFAVEQLDNNYEYVLAGGSFYVLDEAFLVEPIILESLDEEGVSQHVNQDSMLQDCASSGSYIILNFGSQEPEMFIPNYNYYDEDDEYEGD
jgi:hypothetical protein